MKESKKSFWRNPMKGIKYFFEIIVDRYIDLCLGLGQNLVGYIINKTQTCPLLERFIILALWLISCILALIGMSLLLIDSVFNQPGLASEAKIFCISSLGLFVFSFLVTESASRN